MSDNKLLKTIMDAAILTRFVAGIGWIGKKVVKKTSPTTLAPMS